MKLLAPLLALVVALGAAIWLDDTPPRADLVYVNASEVFTLDPQRMTWMQDLRMAYCLYEGLARWNNDDFTVEVAAADWTISDDRRTYTFTLRPDARWSTRGGEPSSRTRQHSIRACSCSSTARIPSFDGVRGRWPISRARLTGSTPRGGATGRGRCGTKPSGCSQPRWA